ncbi:HamA C-terminal domain-containing protein [Maridesulfovibrio frigidus]|uniref:HamA C-terminal domain-containing protein n=1 Tax=Maridesulfovibrio frigidus TaxID=340956 RepID=UPI0004E24B5B|nr:DUF1837 domain-containing protein [Maridesulfovibrio frigidus]
MAKLKTQLENSAEIREILQEVDVSWKWGDDSVDARLIYLPCANGECDISPLFKIIESCLLANFVFSHAQIEKRLAIKSPEVAENLFKNAVKFLSKKTAHGELGELILFTLLDVYLEAPKILSKVSQKSSRRMPVFGADAVHAQYIDGSLRLYLGESKLYKSFKSAATKATTSISNALDNYEHEFSLIQTHINFPDIDNDIEEELLSFLNPFDNSNVVEDVVHSPCFIGFSDLTCFEDDKTYIDSYTKKASEYIGDFYSKLTEKGKPCGKTTLLMLPFSSITDVVNGFVDYMGIEK